MTAALAGLPQTPEVVAAERRVLAAVSRTPPLVVREYAAPRPGAGNAAVEDADTILWQPVIVLPTDGKVKLNFHIGNAPGGYELVVAGHTLDGRLGTVRTHLPVAPAAQDAPAPPK
jgi:hypothetical protein